MWNLKKVSNIYIFLSLHQVFVTSNGNTARLSFKCIQLSAFKMIFNNIMHFWTTQTKHRYLYSCLQLDFFSITNIFTIPLKHLIITFNFFIAGCFRCMFWMGLISYFYYFVDRQHKSARTKQTTNCNMKTFAPCSCFAPNRITVNPEWNLSPLLL